MDIGYTKGMVKMKFKVTRTSDVKYEPVEIELNTLEELINWCDSQNEEIIISIFTENNELNIGLEIYDDWRE